MADYSLVPVDYQPDFGNVSLVPVDYQPKFDDDVVAPQAQTLAQAQTQQGLVQVQPTPIQSQPAQPQPTQDQPAQAVRPQPQNQTPSPAPGQPNDPPAVPISSPDQPAPANQQQPSNVPTPGLANGGDNSPFGRRLLQSVVYTVPGAHYASLAQEEFRRGNYGAAAFYEALALGDAAVGIGTLGASTRVGTGVRAAETALTAESLGAGRAAAETAKEAAPDGRFYSVLFEHRLRPTSYPTPWRYKHNQEANEAFLQAMEADDAFARSMQDLGVNLRRTRTGLAPRRPPPGFTWHHAEEPGVMQLVPKEQHDPGSIFQAVLHPGPRGRGGWYIWGKSES